MALVSQSRKVMGSGENKGGVRAELARSAKAKNVIDATSAFSGAVWSETGPLFRCSKVIMKEYCFVQDASFHEPEDLHDLKTAMLCPGR